MIVRLNKQEMALTEQAGALRWQLARASQTVDQVVDKSRLNKKDWGKRMEGWTVNNKEQRDALIAHIDQCLEKDQFVRFVVHRPETRTQKQNRALWVACEMLATQLNDAGFDIRTFPWKEGVDLPWDKDQVKKRLFDPIMKAMTEKESSTVLNKKEVGDIWEVMMRHVSQTVGVSLPFPTWNQLYASSSAPKKTK